MDISDEWFEMRFKIDNGRDLVRSESGSWDWVDSPNDWPQCYGQWVVAPEGAHAIPKYLCASDYHGSLVEFSNIRAWRERFADTDGVSWCKVSGGHGTQAIVVKVDALTDEQREFLSGLQDYPLADEDLHGEMEMDAQYDAWGKWVRDDFQRDLAERFPDREDAIEEMDGGQLFEIFQDARDRSGADWVNEQGDSMYIDLGRVVAAVEADDLA